MRLFTLRLYLLISSAIIFSSCEKGHVLKDVLSSGKNNTYKGPQVQVGGGHAHSFITISHSGVPKELGIVFTHGALSELPKTFTTYVLELHKKALEVTPFKHVALGWSANGHPLPGSFLGPHFDVRFFMMTLEDRLAIPAPPSEKLLKLPPTGYMPANYSPYVPLAELGMHWTDLSFLPGVTVNHTMILGSYDGQFNFVSPKATQLFLATGQRVSLSYGQPQLFSKHSYYPTKYNIYKDEKQLHYVTLSDFVLR